MRFLLRVWCLTLWLFGIVKMFHGQACFEEIALAMIVELNISLLGLRDRSAQSGAALDSRFVFIEGPKGAAVRKPINPNGYITEQEYWDWCKTQAPNVEVES